jgi:hypothetical protein
MIDGKILTEKLLKYAVKFLHLNDSKMMQKKFKKNTNVVLELMNGTTLKLVTNLKYLNLLKLQENLAM